MKKPELSSGWLHGAGKWITVLLTTAAALVGLLVNAKSLGLPAWLGAGGLSYADIAARRVLVIPIADTLHAIGDTLHLAAIVTDNRGATLSGANVVWTSDNPSVATVDSSGTVIARGPGKAAVAAAVREYSAHSAVIVWQRVSGVMIAHDSVLRFPEGTTIQLVAR